MVDTQKLCKRIDESGLKKYYIASKVSLTTYGLQKKINNQTQFKSNEIEELWVILKNKTLEEKEKKENILPNPPFAKGGDEEEGSEGEKVAEGAGGGMREECDQRSATRKRNLTQEDIDRMQVPPDGCPRNFSGLLENLRLFRVPPAEQYAILLKSNYGEIGGDIWKGFSVIRGSGGKIKLPGHYLLSVLNK